MEQKINLTDKDSTYCINCNFRIEQKGLTGIGFLAFKQNLVADPGLIKTNKRSFVNWDIPRILHLMKQPRMLSITRFKSVNLTLGNLKPRKLEFLFTGLQRLKNFSFFAFKKIKRKIDE